ncbi:caprin-1-like isoform X2 [Anneissia japonica]|uniref:caprin-1-like isoform X2 n=1 Tax=Anneissia japonica TaxID=1529436 RepID=UPI001425B019|nr:caprin-1-like isoform X2 [Anneissia japonica]
MPSASSKVATQFSTTESQDHMKQVLLVVEKKIRNIEKKKGKLEGYRDLVKDGKVLNDDQRQSLKHYDEVLGNLEFAKELHKTFQSLATDYAKMEKKRNKRELVLRQEQEQKTIQSILLLQNVLDNMGQQQIRSDFEAGNNGAIILSAEELTYLDEFYKIACPSREDDEDDTKTTESYEKKRMAAGEHLSKYVRGDESKVCGTTYKELNGLIQRIEECGYLDNIPDFTQEPAQEAAETELRDEEYMTNPETLPAQDTTDVPTSLQPEVSLKSEVEPVPVHPESAVLDTIDYQQETKAARDLDEVLKAVQGSFSFVQDPIDFDAPHLVDPAVVSVSQHSQPFRSQQLSYGTSDSGMMEHSQSHQTLESLQQSGGQVLDQHLLQSPSQTLPTQSSTEQSYSVDQESVLQSNTSTHASSTYQSSMASDQYGATDHYATGGDQFPSATDQYSQSADQYASSRLGTSTDYTQNLGSSSQYSNQVADSAFQQEPMAQQGQLSSGPISIPEPQTIALPTDSSQVAAQVTTQSNVVIPKSTMNASAPPFQSSMAYQMQSSPPIAPVVSTTQGQDAFQNMGSTQMTGTDSYGSTNRNPDPSSVNSDVSGSGYQQQYQQQGSYRNNNRGNRGNRGGVQNTGYRSNRGGGQQYSRGFNQQNYMQRNTYPPRGSDVAYNTGNGGGNSMHTSSTFQNSYRSAMPDNGYQSYDRRTNMPRGNPRGGRGQGPRPGYNNRGRGGFNKTQQLTA